jgi:thiol-disulfide isomerase/thioredoxin
MKKICSIAALLFSFATAFSCIHDDPDKEFELKPGDTIPDFSVTMTDGTTVTAESLREGVAMIMFFNSTCPDCQQTLPSVQRIYDEYKDKGVSFAIISRSQPQSEVDPYWEKQGYTMPYSGQADRAVFNLFADSRVPRVFICLNGRIMSSYKDKPIPTYENMASDIDSIL